MIAAILADISFADMMPPSSHIELINLPACNNHVVNNSQGQWNDLQTAFHKLQWLQFINSWQPGHTMNRIALWMLFPFLTASIITHWKQFFMAAVSYAAGFGACFGQGNQRGLITELHPPFAPPPQMCAIGYSNFTYCNFDRLFCCLDQLYRRKQLLFTSCPVLSLTVTSLLMSLRAYN